jgi:hypothetical protein
MRERLIGKDVEDNVKFEIRNQKFEKSGAQSGQLFWARITPSGLFGLRISDFEFRIS